MSYETHVRVAELRYKVKARHQVAVVSEVHPVVPRIQLDTDINNSISTSIIKAMKFYNRIPF